MSGPSSTLPLPVASNSEEEAATLGGGVSTSSTAAIIPDKSAEPTQSRPGASSEEERKPNAPAPSSLENDTSNNPDSTKETDVPPSLEESPISIPVTILLQSGARHQFSIDRKYLERHNVKGEMMKENLVNPFDMTVWQLKECVWKDWKEEWDQRPASALFIKLIQFGAYMNDSSALRGEFQGFER